MNNKVKGIKKEVSRQSETILAVGLQGLYPWTPMEVLAVCSQDPCCLPWITHYVYDPRKSNCIDTTTLIQILFYTVDSLSISTTLYYEYLYFEQNVWSLEISPKNTA